MVLCWEQISLVNVIKELLICLIFGTRWIQSVPKKNADYGVTENVLNPAFLLHVNEREAFNDCLQAIEQVYSKCISWLYLRGTPVQIPDWMLFTDGNSFVVKGEQKVWTWNLTLELKIEVRPLPALSSSWRADLIILTQALELSNVSNLTFLLTWDIPLQWYICPWSYLEGKRVAIISRESCQEKLEIRRLFDAVIKPKELAVSHCKAYWSGHTDAIKRNRTADEATKKILSVTIGNLLSDKFLY